MTVGSLQTVVLGILMRSIGNKNTILLGLGFQILQLAWYGFGSQPWSVTPTPSFVLTFCYMRSQGMCWYQGLCRLFLLIFFSCEVMLQLCIRFIYFIFLSATDHTPLKLQTHNEMSFLGPHIDFFQRVWTIHLLHLLCMYPWSSVGEPHKRQQ